MVEYMTYLPSNVMGCWFHPYQILDLYSRKVIGAEVHDRTRTLGPSSATTTSMSSRSSARPDAGPLDVAETTVGGAAHCTHSVSVSRYDVSSIVR